MELEKSYKNLLGNSIFLIIVSLQFNRLVYWRLERECVYSFYREFYDLFFLFSVFIRWLMSFLVIRRFYCCFKTYDSIEYFLVLNLTRDIYLIRKFLINIDNIYQIFTTCYSNYNNPPSISTPSWLIPQNILNSKQSASRRRNFNYVNKQNAQLRSPSK